MKARILHGGESRGALLLLHGFMGCASDWEPVARGLISEGFDRKIVALELQGETIVRKDDGHKMLHATHATCSPVFSEMFYEIKDVVAELNLSSVILGGYSLGGRLALGAVLEWKMPIAGLILISTSCGLLTEEERESRRAQDDALALRLEQIEDANAMRDFLHEWWSQPIFGELSQSPYLHDYLLESRLQADPRALASMLRNLSVGRQPSYWGRLKELHFPALVIAGTQDVKFCKIGKAMVQAMPQAQFAEISNAAHMLLLEKPQMIAQNIVRWIRGRKTL